MRRIAFLLITSISLMPAFQTSAQTDHYWAQQYGARSSLMGGAMIGGVRDNSAIFYNPGAFSFIDYPSLSVNANLYKIDKIYIDDGAGEGINLNSAQTSIFPQIISGMVEWDKLPRFRFAYGLLTRDFDNVLMNTRYTQNDVEDIAGLSDSVEAFLGVFDLASQLNEQWFAAGIGYQVTDWLGVGVTLLGSYRTQTTRMSNVIREIVAEGESYGIGSMVYQELVKTRNATGLMKIGINMERGNWLAGLTLTTPSFQAWGRGDIEREFSIYSISGGSADTSDSFIISDRVNSTHARFRHPLSIGAGVEYNNGKTRIALSVEYFARIKQYRMMNPTSNPFIYPPDMIDSAYFEEIIHTFLEVNNAAKPVLNVAVGLEQRLSEAFSLLIGFHTDFSAYQELDNGDNMIHSSGAWNLYHCSAGLSYKLKKQIITAGVNYAFSPTVSVNPFTSINPFEEVHGKARVFPQTFAFILGYTYLFPRE